MKGPKFPVCASVQETSTLEGGRFEPSTLSARRACIFRKAREWPGSPMPVSRTAPLVGEHTARLREEFGL
jgi:hypothetical protein